MGYHRPSTVLTCIAASLVVTATASADRYVSAGAPAGNALCTQVAPCDTLQKAHDAAAANENVTVGPGTFAGNLFDTKRLRWVGAGAGSATGAAGPGDTVLTGFVILDDAGAISKVRVENEFGIGVRNAASSGARTATVSDVVVRALTIGLNGQDTVAGGTLHVDVARSSFVQTAPVTSGDTEFVTAQGAGVGDRMSLSLDHVTVSARDYGVTTDGGALTMTDTTVESAGTTRFAVGTSVGPTVVTRSRITGGRVGIYVDGGSVSLRDSAVQVRDPTPAAGYGVFAGNLEPTTATITGSTIDVSGANVNAAIRVQTSLVMTNSIVRLTNASGPSVPEVLVPGSGTLTISHSALNRVSRIGPIEPPPSGDGNITGDPKLIDPAAGDLRLAGDSPLIDAADPAVLIAGELDLTGAARALDGNGDCSAIPDIGAYERPALVNAACAPPPAPPPPSGGGPPAAPPAVADAAAPPVTAARVAPAAAGPTAATLTFTLGEPADVVVTLETSAKPGAAAVRWRTLGTILRKRLKAGRQTVKVPRKVKGKRLRRGSYRLRIKATDAAGNVTTKRVAFRLKR